MTSFSYCPLQSRNTLLLYSGGLEILFGNESTVSIDVPPPKGQTEVLAKPLGKLLCRPAVLNGPVRAFFVCSLTSQTCCFGCGTICSQKGQSCFCKATQCRSTVAAVNLFRPSCIVALYLLHTRVPQHLIHPLPMCTDRVQT